MRILLDAICRAGLNKGRIRDALTGLTSFKGVTGDLVFDPNCNNIAPLFLGQVHNGQITYRRITMEKPYAQVGEGGVQFVGPSTPAQSATDLRLGIFGPRADEVVRSPEIAKLLSALNANGQRFSLVAVSSEAAWGKASNELVNAVYQDHVLALIALDRASSHLAEQIAVKSFVPVIAISSDHALTTSNIPWIFRLPEGTSLGQDLKCLSAAIAQAGPNRSSVREILASGKPLAGVRFASTGEVRQ
jgi:branched-chain amino acid transport system substrate-binding protein